MVNEKHICPKCLVECNFIEENIRLNKRVNFYHDRINNYNKKNTEIKLQEYQIKLLETSLTPLNLRILRHLNKNDIIVICLNREAFLYDTINKFQDNIKHNDRVVFKNQQKEIAKLTTLLIDSSPLFRENQKLKKKMKLSNDYRLARLLDQEAKKMDKKNMDKNFMDITFGEEKHLNIPIDDVEQLIKKILEKHNSNKKL